MSSIPTTPAAGSPGKFGQFGGQFVAETLMPALIELDAAWNAALADDVYKRELARLLATYVGRPTPLTLADNLGRAMAASAGQKAGPRIYLKREDLAHTGAHKINNCLGQALLALRMKKRRIIAETGAGQHGVATATACALLGLECEIYMGATDVERQSLNVFRMKLLGAKVHPVNSGSRTLKDAMNEAMRDWVTNVRTTHYLIGSVAGPHPYPTLVRELQRVIGKEAKAQVKDAEGRLPAACIACVGGGSNAMGLFADFIDDKEVRLIGIEAAGDGIGTGRHAATLSAGRVAVLHGAKSYVLCDDEGQIIEPHSISAGLDYPGVGPEHSSLKDSGRATYFGVTDDQALAAFELLGKTEGILPALESAHAIAGLAELVKKGDLAAGAPVVVCLSGRGDKDMNIVARKKGVVL